MKFSIECFLSKQDGEINTEDTCICGEHPLMSDWIDFPYSGLDEEILDAMKKQNLPDGEYHGFFIGNLEWDNSYNYEYGVEESEPITIISEFHFYSVPVGESK